MYEPAERRAIAAQCERPGCIPSCPRCGDVLEARPATRLAAIAEHARPGYDLDCRDCRLFSPVARRAPAASAVKVDEHGVTRASVTVHGLRLRRLAAAVLGA
jgi:hypothetical protein